MAYKDTDSMKYAQTLGMMVVYLGLLKRGPKWTAEETPQVLALQEAHLANIDRMVEKGKLVLVGPLLDNSEIRGIYIFKVKSFKEAEKLTKRDPAVKAGRLTVDIHPWMIAKDKL
ncbi:MAG: YciI family protein [Chloroflexota bacterium]